LGGGGGPTGIDQDQEKFIAVSKAEGLVGFSMKKIFRRFWVVFFAVMPDSISLPRQVVSRGHPGDPRPSLPWIPASAGMTIFLANPY
jgi:hypothetical protein